MDTKNIEKEEGKVKFQVVVDAQTFELAVNKVYKSVKSRIQVPGFRKGKAPRQIIEGMYGKNVFYEDAVEDMALDCFKTGVKETGERTVGDPQISNFDVADDKTLTISFEAALYPEVTLGAYKGLEAYRAPVVISDEDVDKELEAVRKRNARILTAERPAQNGDTVNIDFDGFKNGKRFEGGKAEGHNLVLGSGSFVNGFEEQLIGAKAGDSLDVNITFPENYSPELGGADAVFKVKVNAVQETILPELDDEFAKDVSEFDTLGEYRESIRKDLQERREEVADNNFRNLLVRKAVENMTVEVPDAMLNQRVNSMMEDAARRCRMQGMTMDHYLQMMGMNAQMYRSYIRPTALSDLRTEILLEKVADVEGLTVSDEEIEQEYAENAERYGMKADALKEGVPRDIMENDLKMRKATDLIFENGVPTDKAEGAEESNASLNSTNEEREKSDGESEAVVEFADTAKE